jgi:hypothetical protein
MFSMFIILKEPQSCRIKRASPPPPFSYLKKKKKKRPGTVSYACNLSYLGGRDREAEIRKQRWGGSRFKNSQAKKLARPNLIE